MIYSQGVCEQQVLASAAYFSLLVSTSEKPCRSFIRQVCLAGSGRVYHCHCTQSAKLHVDLLLESHHLSKLWFFICVDRREARLKDFVAVLRNPSFSHPVGWWRFHMLAIRRYIIISSHICKEILQGITVVISGTCCPVKWEVSKTTVFRGGWATRIF